MNPVWPIAAITYKEGIRNRAIYGITLLALFLLIANHLVSSMIMREVGKVAVDMSLSAVSLGGILLIFFVVINLMAKDLDKRTIYMVITRPVSRAEYILGKFLGVSLLITVSTLFLSIIASASILIVKLTYPNYFHNFSWSLIALSLFFTLLALLLMAALSFLFSTITSTSFVAQVLTIIAYLIGHSLTDVKALVESPQSVGISVSPATVYLVKIAYYVFPNLSLFDIKIQAAHGIAISISYIAWTVLYAVVYTSLALVLAIMAFRRKEFP